MCRGGGSRGTVVFEHPRLGTLVVVNIDDGDYLQAISVESTPFNTPLEWCSVQSAHARVGLRGHLWIQNWSKMIFLKRCS